MVILLLAGIGIMAAIALWVSLRNVQMKTTDAEIKESFYSAEGVLEQIKAGVQEKAEIAYKNALTKDLESFAKYKKGAALGTPGTPQASNRADEFKKNFIDSFKEGVYGSNQNFYNVDSISDLVDKNLLDSPAYPYALVTAVNSGNNSTRGIIKDSGDKLVLEHIRVRYVSSKEQVSEIITDINVDVPKPESIASAAVTDIFEYAIIGNRGVDIKAGPLSVNGNIYAGFNNPTEKSAFVISPNTRVTLNDKIFIANGKITIGNGAKLATGTKEKLWAENIVLDSSALELTGASYIADDLTLAGDGSQAVISGIYKGYGNVKNSAKGSSAIIVNGKNSSIDMRNAREVVLSGYSFIGTGNKKLRLNTDNGESANNTDIKMGESIAVKGNQIAYLMPGEWIGTDSNSVSRFKHNPLTYEEYQSLLNDNDATGNHYTLVNTKVKSNKTGKSLEDYGIDETKLNEGYSKIFVQPITGISADGLVYFYVNLPQDMAGKYFKDYYNADKNMAKELNKHTKFYAGSIKSDFATNIRTAGNYSTFENDILTVRGGKTGSDKDSKKYLKEYRSLCTNLSTDVVAAGQGENEVFNNIMNTSVLNQYLSGKMSCEVTAGGAKAIVVEDNYTYDNSSGNVKLIVAKGDVTIKQTFTGSIIAGGKIIVEGTTGSISTDDSGVVKQLLREPLTTGGNDYLYKIFANGDALVAASGTENANILFEDGSVDVSKLISYSNWKKN